MPRPTPLSGPAAARRTLAHRLTPLADRLRQLSTRFGLRSQRVFLVWTEWSGIERGEGIERVIAEVELLPTPRVSDLSSIVYRPYSAGRFPEGSLRVDQISCGAYTADVLCGRAIPSASTSAPNADQGRAANFRSIERASNPRIDFWWEVVEDGRGDEHPLRTRFRVLGLPSRKEGSLYWAVNLEAASEARNRLGTSTQVGVDFDEELVGLPNGRE